MITSKMIWNKITFISILYIFTALNITRSLYITLITTYTSISLIADTFIARSKLIHTISNEARMANTVIYFWKKKYSSGLVAIFSLQFSLNRTKLFTSNEQWTFEVLCFHTCDWTLLFLQFVIILLWNKLFAF